MKRQLLRDVLSLVSVGFLRYLFMNDFHLDLFFVCAVVVI